jgi:hypothetical protein
MASRASLAKREAPAVSPTSLAAVRTPQPGSSSKARADEDGQLALELRGTARKLATAADKLASDSYLRRLRKASEQARYACEPARAIERAGGHLELRAELVQVPAQAVLNARALGDEVLAVVDEQPDLATFALETSSRELGLAQSGSGDGERIDRIRLAALTDRATRPGHQLRRDAHDPLARGKQEALEADRDVAAVLERPQPLAGKRARPLDQLLVAPTARLDRPLTSDLAA